MEDPPIEAMIRRNALQMAITYLGQKTIPYTPNDVIGIADTFYQFLKGEKK